jgi:dTDP-D-glucose 4,6-dehydratase
MLYAKITPSAEKVIQTSPFSSTTITADYMSALARPYGLGSNIVNFEVLFGNVSFDENQQPISFQNVVSSQMTLEGSQLENWGIDDTVILQEMATILGLTIESFVTIVNTNPYQF